MKTLLIIATVMLALAVGYAAAVYTITLTDLRVENIQIFRQEVLIDEETGETATQMKMSMNYTLTDGINNKGMNTEFTLSAAQRTQVLNFIKPFVQAQAVTDGVNAPPWSIAAAEGGPEYAKGLNGYPWKTYTQDYSLIPFVNNVNSDLVWNPNQYGLSIRLGDTILTDNPVVLDDSNNPLGSGASPTYSFSSDPDTGMSRF